MLTCNINLNYWDKYFVQYKKFYLLKKLLSTFLYNGYWKHVLFAHTLTFLQHTCTYRCIIVNTTKNIWLPTTTIEDDRKHFLLNGNLFRRNFLKRVIWVHLGVTHRYHSVENDNGSNDVTCVNSRQPLNAHILYLHFNETCIIQQQLILFHSLSIF